MIKFISLFLLLNLPHLYLMLVKQEVFSAGPGVPYLTSELVMLLLLKSFVHFYFYDFCMVLFFI